MRGFGVTGVDFAIECQMDKVADDGRHGPDRVAHPQRLSRRRHEGASARGQEQRADRMLPGRGGEGRLADLAGIAAASVAHGGGGDRGQSSRQHRDRSGRRRRVAARRQASHAIAPQGVAASGAPANPACGASIGADLPVIVRPAAPRLQPPRHPQPGTAIAQLFSPAAAQPHGTAAPAPRATARRARRSVTVAGRGRRLLVPYSGTRRRVT